MPELWRRIRAAANPSGWQAREVPSLDQARYEGACGVYYNSASIAVASVMSSAVNPPASWVDSVTSTRFQTLNHSG